MAIGSIETRLSSALAQTGIRVATPESNDYQELMIRWSDAAERKAAVVLLPKSEEEISQCVKACRDLGVDFVISGGRHNASGASSIENGAIIDLRLMNKVIVDPEAKTITAEGGSLWAELDEEAAKYDLCVVGGTVNHTGVAGLTLGGGFGWLTGKYGLTIDNLLSVRMILADGNILTASEKENTDLFWAIRGSGSNFGVAASFTFRAHPKPPVACTSQLVFAPAQLPQIVDYINKYDRNMRDDSAFAMAFAPGPAGPILLCVALLFGSEVEAREYFSDLFAIGPLMEQVAEIPYEKLNSLLNEVMKYGRRKAMGGSAFKLPLDHTFVQSVQDKWMQFVSESGIPETFVVWEVYPNKKVQEVPLTDMSFANRGDFYNIAFVTMHEEESQDSIARNFIKTTSQYIRENSGLKGEKGVGVYANYVETGKLTAENLFGPNMDRLLKLKKQYDPDNCFRSWHNIEKP